MAEVLRLGDCMEVMRQFVAEGLKFDLIYTDPPYDISATNGGGSMHKSGKLSSLKELAEAKINKGYDIEEFGELALKLQDNVNMYFWCNKIQIPRYLDFYVNTHKCKFDILFWAKCLSGSTELFVKSKRYDIRKVNLKDIYRYDYKDPILIYTGDSFVPITNIIKSTKTEWLEIELNNGNCICCSEEHPFYVGGVRVDAGSLTEGDVLDSKKVTFFLGEDLPYISDDAAWLCGFYLANGCKQVHKKLSFAQNANKEWQTDVIKRVCKQYGGSYYIFNASDNSRVVNVTSKVIEAIVDTYIVGKDCYTKHLTSRCFNSGGRILRKLLQGYLDGDAYNDIQNSRYILSFTRKNYDLARDLLAVTNLLGYNILMKKDYSVFNNKKYATWRAYIRYDSIEPAMLKSPFAIRKIQKKKGKKDFYDISIESADHLFVLSDGVITHNCNPLPTYSNKYLSDIEYCLYFRKGGYCMPQSYDDARTFYQAPINAKDKKLYGHPTIKPLDAVMRHIRNSSKENDLVFDPFMGSGTTGVACKRLNRNFIGIELDENYFNIAKGRIENEHTETL